MWEDWHDALLANAPGPARDSLSRLARYANPKTVSHLGIMLGAGRLPGGALEDATTASVARTLAARLSSICPSYTVEPYRPGGQYAQTIRTAEELRAGMGTCLDFVVAVAAGCVHERVDVCLCVLRAGSRAGHAFLAIPPATWKPWAEGPYRTLTTQEFLAGPVGEEGFTVLDPTPLPRPGSRESEKPEKPESLVDRATEATGAALSRDGHVFVVHVQTAVDEARSFWTPPTHARALGITTLLPDPLDGARAYSSRVTLETRLASTTGTVVLYGDSGTGKSTLALGRAHGATDRNARGWLLDGSDRAALRLSLARCEAQCRGEELNNIQPENVSGYVASAQRRLAETTLSWTVIVDNADGDVESIADLLPVPGPGQLVIVTTTNPEWKGRADSSGWPALQVLHLETTDLNAGESALHLSDEDRLPGVVRLGVMSGTGELPADSRSLAGLLALAVGKPDDVISGLSDGGTLQEALVAAATMPPEDVRHSWIRAAVTQSGRATDALRRLLELGVLETSRIPHDPRVDELPTMWMHRLVRTACRELYLSPDGPAAAVACKVLAAEPDQAPRVVRSVDDLTAQANYLRAAVSDPPVAFAGATVTILNALESRGGTRIQEAANLAREALPAFPDARPGDWNTRSVVALAIARLANHKRGATEDEIGEGIRLCQEIVRNVAVEPDEPAAAGSPRPSSLEDRRRARRRLTAGRAEAMRAILIGKLADRVLARDREAGEALLDQNIAVLTKSFEDRAAALGWAPAADSTTDIVREAFAERASKLGHTPSSTVDDPERHVDRAWFNLGGAHIKRAKPYLPDRPTEDRLASLREQWRRSLVAYAGSLSLRTDQDLYRAASLNGVALVCYMTALNCAGPLNLAEVPRTAPLDLLWLDQSRAALLRVAEMCATEALAIRAGIAGPFSSDTGKTRDVLMKLVVAWKVTEPSEAGIGEALGRVGKEVAFDVGIT